MLVVEKPGKDLTLAVSYRPVSSPSVCYKKLPEHLALQCISATIEGLLIPNQAGF